MASKLNSLKLSSCILLLVIGGFMGYAIGHEVGRLKAWDNAWDSAMLFATDSITTTLAAETDYYAKAVNGGLPLEPMSKDEVITTLISMQRTHQIWYDNPEWYDYSESRRETEAALVNSYERIIRYVEVCNE